jgi:hypothetical protein
LVLTGGLVVTTLKPDIVVVVTATRGTSEAWPHPVTAERKIAVKTAPPIQSR